MSKIKFTVFEIYAPSFPIGALAFFGGKVQHVKRKTRKNDTFQFFCNFQVSCLLVWRVTVSNLEKYISSLGALAAPATTTVRTRTRRHQLQYWTLSPPRISEPDYSCKSIEVSSTFFFTNYCATIRFNMQYS